ncbi:unnamed protein product [Diamesa hyperborea]
MMNMSPDLLRIKAVCDNVTNNLSKDNADALLIQIENFENVQFLQDYLLSNILKLVDTVDGVSKNETKTSLIKCVIAVLRRSKIMKDVPYKLLLIIILKQILISSTKTYNPDLSEELKIAILECFEVASKQLDFDVIEKVIVKENQPLLAQCIFLCVEMISKEKYQKIRIAAIHALTALTQTHDNIEENDLILKDQISKIMFIMFPKIVAVLIQTSVESTVKGPALNEASLRALGKFLCLIFEDYEKKPSKPVSITDFKNLMKPTGTNTNEERAILGMNKKGYTNYAENASKSKEWILAVSKNVAKPLEKLKSVRGNDYHQIRFEIASMSWNLIDKCLQNIQCLVPFLLENLILCADDSNEKIKKFSKEKLKKIAKRNSMLNNELADLFCAHMTTMPRIIHTGDESEQIAGITLLNSYIEIMSSNNMILLESPLIMENFTNILLSCCELDVKNELLFCDSVFAKALEDQFYQMKMPWKHFKNLQNEKIVLKFLDLCQSIGKSKYSHQCIDHLLSNINSLEYLVLINEIMNVEDSLKIEKVQVHNIVEEFLDDVYWQMSIKPKMTIPKVKGDNDEWYEDRTPGLYESGIEIKMTEMKLEDEKPSVDSNSTLKEIKYNILSTCLVLELIGKCAKILKTQFERYLLRALHRTLEKAGSSNFLIKCAGIYALENITHAIGLKEVPELIDQHSDFLLFNIQKILKKNHENEAVLDMMDVVFKYSRASLTLHIETIVETVFDQITKNKYNTNYTSFLKLFRLYVSSVKKWEQIDVNAEITNKLTDDDEFDEFLQQCLIELNLKQETEEEIMNEPSNVDQVEKTPENEDEEVEEEILDQLPDHIVLVLKILNSTTQFFAARNASESVLVHELFLDGLEIIKNYENQLLPLIHQLWYPFTKQFQMNNLIVLQYSFNLLMYIASIARDFIHKRSLNDTIPVLNKFLLTCSTSKESSLSYTQQFKLQRNILENYGTLLVDLGIDGKELDGAVTVLLKYHSSSNQKLKEACSVSLEILKLRWDPALIYLKLKFLK